MNRFYGKYRGKVVNNVDPLQLGRLQVSVPSVLGSGRLSWAMPCTPYAGPGVGLLFLPPMGADLWVEFEGGDPDLPIWVGGFWGLGDTPVLPAIPQKKVLCWSKGVSLTLTDIPGAGSLSLEVGPPFVPVPLKLVFDSSGIELKNGAMNVKLSAASVSVNGGALEVS